MKAAPYIIAISFLAIVAGSFHMGFIIGRDGVAGEAMSYVWEMCK